MQKIRILFVFILFAILLVGCKPKQDLGYEVIDYYKDNRKYTIEVFPELKPSMEWIKNNLPENAIVSAWWDYGHMIRGITKRDVIVFTPSKEILNSVGAYLVSGSYPSKYGELSKHQDIKNVALILTTTNPEEAINLMNKYNSKYILATKNEYGKGYFIYNVSDVPAEIVETDDQGLYTVNKNSIMHKMLKSQPIDGFEKIYSDDYVTLYKIKS